MNFDRRTFVGATGITLGAALVGRIAEAQVLRDGRTPITRKEWDRMIRSDATTDFTCVQSPQMTEGPFYYESSPERRAIAEQHRGEPLRLGITLGSVTLGGGCHPLRGAVIDVWHTDAAGLYSNVGPDLQPVDTTGQTFLRGHQRTDGNGYVEFDTIMPGWEIVAAAPPVNVARRTTHIHVKAYHDRDVLTTQLFFPDELIDMLYAEVDPYRSHVQLTAPGLDRPYSRIRNGEDIFYLSSNARPMSVERVNGVLTAKATIGVIGDGTRNFEPLFR